MKRTHLLSLTGALLLTLAGGADPYGIKEPSAEELARMEQAMPAKTTMPFKKAHRILIISQCEGFKHSSVPYVEKAFEILGKKTGAFSTVATIDTAIFEDNAKLNTFDAILFNNNTMRLPLLSIDTKGMDDAQKQAAEAREMQARKNLLDFVRNGKGVIGVHAATDCFYKWAEYGEMMGGFFSYHPWHEDVGVKLDDPGHPLAKAFNGQPFIVKDEIYQFKEPYSRDKLRVLLSLDTSKTNMTKKGIKRTDGDFAVSWIHPFGKGRVFYFSLGHRHEIFWNEPVMQHYLDGIQYALGDFPCDDQPSATLGKEYLDASRQKGYDQGITAIFDALSGYQMGVNDSRAKTIAAMVLKEHKASNSPIRTDLSARLATVAANPKATLDGRVFACRQLALIGGDNAISSLASILDDPKVGQWARYALEANPSPAAGKALLAALPQAKGLVQAGIVDSLGARKMEAAVPGLASLVASKDRFVATAAINALGRIGTTAAANALKKAPATLALPANRALLACAGALKSAELYEAVLTADTADFLRAEAFEGKCILQGANAAAEINAVLQSENNFMVAAAANAIRQINQEALSAAVSANLLKIPAASQALAVDALAACAYRPAQKKIIALTTNDNETTARAALQALQFVGDAQAVIPLATVAAGNGKVAEDARRSLARMTPENVNPAIVATIATADLAVKTELVKALGARQAKETIPTLLQTARDKDRTLSKESRRSIATLAEPKDLPAVIALLGEQKKSSARNELGSTITAVAKRVEDESGKTAAIIAGIKSDMPVKPRAKLIECLGRIAANSSLPVLYSTLESPEAEIKTAGIKALADWPDATPMNRLRKISNEDEVLKYRILALRGYARQLAMPSSRPAKETFALYREALDMAKGDQEKKTLITGLGSLAHPDALEFVKPYMSDPAVESEALMAALQITQALNGKSMTFTASHGQDAVRNTVDGIETTRWTSGTAMRNGMWFQVDLGYQTNISEIWTFAGPVGNDYPRGYEAYVSLDGKDWGEPVAKGGSFNNKKFTIKFPPKYGRFVKIVQTGNTQNNFWSIAELSINGRPSKKGKTLLKRDKWKLSASRSAGDAPATNAIDGDLNKRWGTGGAMKPGDFLQVDLGEEKTVYRLILDAAKSRQDFPREIRVFHSLDGKKWQGPIGVAKGDGPATPCILLPTKTRFLKIEQTGSHDTYWWSVYDLKIYGE